MLGSRRCVVILLLCLVPALGRAQTLGAKKELVVTRVTDAPRVDGKLDDSAWAQAKFVSDLRQQEPVENGRPSVRTEIAFVYDKHALYVAARMFTASPGDVQAVATRRDDTGRSERIIVSLDTFNDRRTAYSFAVTAAGVRADWFHPDDTSWDRDASFDPVWEAEVEHGTDSWIAEMRIPFSQLRFRWAKEQDFRVNINRYIAHRNEDIFWIVVPKGVTAWSSRFGRMKGIKDLDLPPRLELRPYAVGELALTSPELIARDDPFTRRYAPGGRVGLDVKAGLGPSLTLDTAIYPDFGQVEADPAVVNLTAFETRLAERRPFFVEGNQMLTGRGPAYYYSRRIGGVPRGDIDADYVDRPVSTPILGAAKLTGKLPSRLSIGALSALTDRVEADTFDTESSRFGRVLVEPLTSYNLLRAEQEFGGNSSKVGATLTGVYRDLGVGRLARSQFNRWASTGGADWNLRFHGAEYELTGATGFSAVGGEPEAIAELQQRSAHYFQRPDQDHVELDPTRRSLLGWMAALGGGKRSGPLTWNVSGYAESPGFELNDLGRLQAADDIGLTTAVTRRSTAPGAWLHAWEVGLEGVQEWNFGGVRAPASANVAGSMTLPNFWQVKGRLGGQTPGFDDALTRGGPLMALEWGKVAGVGLSNAYGARTHWEIALDWEESETGLTGIKYTGVLSVQPVDRLFLSLSPRYLHHSDSRQYVDTIEGEGGRTFGNRYLFATVDRRELALQARVQLALSPDLTVEAYAEPFSSSGDFRDFGELLAASSERLRRYGTDGTSLVGSRETVAIVDGENAFEIENPDFTALSLRSTVVVRWEFLPGSSAFLVWQQDGSDELPVADARGHLRRVLSAPARHVFALKFVYFWAG